MGRLRAGVLAAFLVGPPTAVAWAQAEPSVTLTRPAGGEIEDVT